MRRVPDHNTLCRAFKVILSGSRIGRLLDLLARWMGLAKSDGNRLQQSTQRSYDTHHRSRHYEQRCRHYSSRDKNTANFRRSRSARRTPKLSLSIDVRSHIILAARGHARGWDLDARDFLPLLRYEQNSSARQIRDSSGRRGEYDSHENHRVARTELKVRSLDQSRLRRPAQRQTADIEVSPHDAKKAEPDRRKANPTPPSVPRLETVNSMMKTQPWRSSSTCSDSRRSPQRSR